jgi:hypothetical protein
MHYTSRQTSLLRVLRPSNPPLGSPEESHTDPHCSGPSALDIDALPMNWLTTMVMMWMSSGARLRFSHFEVAVDDLEVLFGFVVEVFLELMALVTVMDELDGLLEGYGDEEADDDGDDVNEEVAPGGGGVVWWVYVDDG